MKKHSLFVLTVLLLLSVMTLPAYAKSYNPDPGWYVTFSGSKLYSNFTSQNIADLIIGLQSGDDTTIKIAVRNDSDEQVAYYMNNAVLKALEETRSGISGGAYSYTLTYTAPNGTTTTLFDSKNMGGSDTTGGLGNLPGNLKDFFYLSDVPSGGQGTVTLKVKLEGESTINNYQNTIAKIKLQFAVEKSAGNYIPSTGEGGTIVFWIGMMLLSMVLILMAARLLLKNKKEGQDK